MSEGETEGPQLSSSKRGGGRGSLRLPQDLLGENKRLGFEVFAPMAAVCEKRTRGPSTIGARTARE